MIAATSLSFQHELETPQPLRAERGHLHLEGWCICVGRSIAPAVRLVNSAQILTTSTVVRRPDVTTAWKLDASAVECGFIIEGKLSPGAHFVALEASCDKLTWQVIRQLTIIATVGELQVSIDWPVEPTVRDGVRVQGWCLHPDFTLAEVWLHYGNRQLKCEYGLPRADVAGLFPHAPNANHAGFIAEKNLPAGYGPLRIRAVTSTGESIFTQTAVTIDIVRDEENSIPLDLHGKSPDLGLKKHANRIPSAPISLGGHAHRILFVLYGDFTSNSAFQVSNLANALLAQGHECIVTVPHNVETVRYHPDAKFTALSFDQCLKNPAAFSGGRTADIIHAWTTRENVRQFCENIRGTTPSKLIIHLEDHELRIVEDHTSRSLDNLLALPETELDALVPSTLSHPRHSRSFIQSADAVTVIIDRLREMVPEGKLTHIIWPAADETRFFPRPIPGTLRHALGWDERHTVIFYHGNVHATNASEMRELYAAVLELNQAGHPATLVRAGRDDGNFLGALADRVAPFVIALGQLPNHRLPQLMALADFFVQPGVPDTFNDYRFPSKLPEFFALGRPVILPRTNLGGILRHGEDAWILAKADAAGIVEAVIRLSMDPGLRERLTAGASSVTARYFDWRRSASDLLAFYNSLPSTR
ncbi:MAG: glycosyltransferase family 4 protein [Lacunisphaera sp.]